VCDILLHNSRLDGFLLRASLLDDLLLHGFLLDGFLLRLKGRRTPGPPICASLHAVGWPGHGLTHPVRNVASAQMTTAAQEVKPP